MPNLPISQLPLAVSGQPESWMAIVNYDVDPNGVTNKIYFSALTEQFSGTTGTSGTSGVDGSSGTSGTSGIDGSSGTSGTSGIDGSSGTSGTSGIDGSSGTSGTSGVDGSSGTSGTSGVDGSSGTSGTSGIDGSSGTSGTSGIDGSSGTSGTSGIDGSSGTSGTSGTSFSPPYPVVYGLFSQTGTTTVITGTTEQTMINGGVGTLTVGANQFQVGDSFDATFSGLITNTNNHTVRFKIEADSVILADSGVISIAANTDSVFYLQLNFVIRAIGGTGTASIYTVGTFQTSKPSNASLDGFGFDDLNNTTFDTTIPNTLDVTLEFGTTGDSLQVEFFRLNKTF